MLMLPAAYSQVPGQYPPGQYPPGRYPPGQGPGVPVPRRGKSSTMEQKSEHTYVIRGVVRTVESKNIEVDADDERIVTFQIAKETKKPDKLVPGDKVEIDATQDDKGVFTATTVKKTGSAPVPPPSTEQPAAAEEARPTTTMATPVPLDPNEDGPPKLMRGVPKTKKPSASTSEVARTELPATSETLPATDNGHLELIEKTRQMSEEFLSGLPNYMCQQFTTRYISEGHVTDWKAQDVVSADLVYENGKERYEHISIGGRLLKKSIEETGAWSTGEFGTVLADLFSPATAAEFKFAGNRSIRRQVAALYDFEVTHPHSHWKIQVPGQAVMPAYRGSVWISNDNARVLRIEMQAVKIPVDFPYDKTELALDYDYVALANDKFLLPVKAEILMCQRGASICERNLIEFRNYHKYVGQSDITFH